MIFKTESAHEQYPKLPPLLRHMMDELSEMCSTWNIEPFCTRVADPVTGDSGVHEVYRAIDIRDQFDGEHVFTEDQIGQVVSYFNDKYRRTDGKPTCLYHSFQGGPYHLHFQQAPALSRYVDQDAVNSFVV